MTDETLPFLHPRTVAIIQARMGSSRLPGKVMLDIGGVPMLRRVVERTRRAETVHEVIVATTTEPEDAAIQALCDEMGYPCMRGSLHDVLDRYYQAGRMAQAEIVVRITADCPLIDPRLIDRTVYAFLGRVEPQDQYLSKLQAHPLLWSPENWLAFPFDFAANRLPPPWGRTYPIGLDTEVCSFEALESAWQEADQPYQREHVLPYLYEYRDRFRTLLVNHTQDFGSLRWTVDVPEDLELVRQIYAHFQNQDDFSWLDVLELVQQNPRLLKVNAQVRHKNYNEFDLRHTGARK